MGIRWALLFALRKRGLIATVRRGARFFRLHDLAWFELEQWENEGGKLGPGASPTHRSPR